MNLANNIVAVGSNPRPSTVLDVSGAMDIDVAVTLPGRETVSGEVTLAPQQYDGRLAAYGSTDQWISGGLLSEIYAAAETDDGSTDRALLRAFCIAIESAAIEAL